MNGGMNHHHHPVSFCKQKFGTTSVWLREKSIGGGGVGVTINKFFFLFQKVTNYGAVGVENFSYNYSNNNSHLSHQNCWHSLH